MLLFKKLNSLYLILFVLFINNCLRAQNGISLSIFFKRNTDPSLNKMQGRFMRTKQNIKASTCIKKYFKEYGLKTFNNNYYQSFNYL